MKKEIDFLRKNISKNSLVVIACSGGPDSMCLLSLLEKIKEELNIKIIVAHVNHCLRDESNYEEEMVKKYALKNNHIFECLRLTEYNQEKFNEQDGHNKRYKFFNDVMDKYESKILLTAHHGDDLIETILMRINRGSNLSGYKGITSISKSNDKLILRPLLTTTKEDILEYNKKENITYCVDKSNESDKYTRNRYRKVILPFLKKENNNVHTKYLKFSEELNDYDEFVTNYIKAKNIFVDNYLFINKLKEETEFIRKKSIELLIKEVQKNDYLEVNDIVLKDLLKLIDKNNKTINLNNEFLACNFYNKLYIEKIDKRKQKQIILKDNIKYNDYNFKLLNNTDDFSNNVICLNSKEIKEPLMIRNWQQGDKMQVKNLSGTKKLSDIFTNSKVPKTKRSTYPVLIDANNMILWLPMLKKSQFAKDKSEKYDIIIKCEAR